MEYLLQICYTVQIDNSTTSIKEKYEQCDKLSNQLELLLPEEINADGICAIKRTSSFIELNEGINCLKCEMCGDYTALPGSSALSSIPEGIEIEGKTLCKHCAWDIKH